MKQTVHPQVNPVIFVDVATGKELVTTSTLTSQETRDVDGVSYFVIKCDVTSYSHPFFTGEMRFVDRQGRVDKFQKKMALAEERKAAEQAKKSKKAQKSNEPAQSYQEILRDQQSTMRKASKAKAAPAADNPAASQPQATKSATVKPAAAAKTAQPKPAAANPAKK